MCMRAPRTARAQSRRAGLLSALRAHANARQKSDLLRRPLQAAQSAPGGSGQGARRPMTFCGAEFAVAMRAASFGRAPRAREVLGWPRRCKLARPFMWEYSYKRLKLAQPLDQRGVFLT